MIMFKMCFPAVCIVPFTIFVIVLGQNYPEYNFYKPCGRLKNTVNYQKPICLDDGNGGFEEQSKKNCEESFRLTCPEFNEASCEWLNNVSFPNSSVGPTPVPCCRLKYFARHYTWLEIYYTNQYGKNVSVYDIVEIHRRIKNHESFGKRDQADWPNSVMDPTGERGLTWTVETNLTKFPTLNGSASDFCAGANDSRCSVDLLQYFALSYPRGFRDLWAPPLSANETRRNATLNYTLSAACRDIWLETKTAARACQILYWYNSTYFVKTYRKNLVFPFLEVQTYYAPPNSSAPQVRFSYWSRDEDPESRFQLFNAAHCTSLDPPMNCTTP